MTTGGVVRADAAPTPSGHSDASMPQYQSREPVEQVRNHDWYHTARPAGDWHDGR